MRTLWWLLFIWPIIPIFAKEIQWKTEAKNSTGKSLYKPHYKGPHFGLFHVVSHLKRDLLQASLTGRPGARNL